MQLTKQSREIIQHAGDHYSREIYPGCHEMSDILSQLIEIIVDVKPCCMYATIDI